MLLEDFPWIFPLLHMRENFVGLVYQHLRLEVLNDLLGSRIRYCYLAVPWKKWIYTYYYFFFPWSWLIVWRVFTNQFHVKKLRDKNKINLCMHLSSGGADTTLAHVYPAMIALLFAVGGIFQKKLFLDKKFWIQTNNSFLYTIF